VCESGCPIKEIDKQSGITRSPKQDFAVVKATKCLYANRRSVVLSKDVSTDDIGSVGGGIGYGDSGGASRYFQQFKYAAKAVGRERDEGCDRLLWKLGSDRPSGVKRIGPKEWEELGQEEERLTKETGHPVRLRVQGNIHDTVKPVNVMVWLVRLVTPPRGRVLDPFTGSGTTLVAALREGFQVVGIERDPDYFLIAQARALHAEKAAKGRRQPQEGPAWAKRPRKPQHKSGEAYRGNKPLMGVIALSPEESLEAV
jgi:hypothetical protein